MTSTILSELTTVFSSRRGEVSTHSNVVSGDVRGVHFNVFVLARRNDDDSDRFLVVALCRNSRTSLGEHKQVCDNLEEVSDFVDSLTLVNA